MKCIYTEHCCCVSPTIFTSDIGTISKYMYEPTGVYLKRTRVKVQLVHAWTGENKCMNRLAFIRNERHVIVK